MSLKHFTSILLSLLIPCCSLDLQGSLVSIDAQDDSDITTDDFSDIQCTTDEQCDNMNPCDGQEHCDTSGYCVNGTPLWDGAVCAPDPRSICLSGNCQVSICGDGYIDAANGEECDDANLVPGDGCENDCILTNECMTDGQCNDGHDCTYDYCDLDLHICIHPTLTSDFICRPSTGQCDIDDFCDGVSPDCPPDQFSPVGTPCNDSDPCTYPDQCNGTSNCTGVNVNEIHDVAALSSGASHTCAIFTDRSVKCWGCNDYGQLGDGTTASKSFPIDVVGLPAGATSISCGYNHTCTTLVTGALYCWGCNDNGQLGNESIASSPMPIQVPALSSGVMNVSSGFSFTCCLQNTGAVKCWGSNLFGALGDGTTIEKHSPTDVIGLTSGVAAISSGVYHVCALLSSGGVKCWGYNGAGELGDNTMINRPSPVDVNGLSSGVSSISSGGLHTCALLASGAVKCWGYNEHGQLGNGTVATSLIPIDVTGLTTGVQALDSGAAHTCAILSTGGIKCWGNNLDGQLGDGTTVNRNTPADVSEIASGALSISAGGFDAYLLFGSHTCALMNYEEILCWGYNGCGQLGDGTTNSRSMASTVECE